MSVKLKVLHGSIKKRGKWKLTVPIRKSPFVIGQGEDCHMRCFGQAIQDYHCEILVDGFDVLLCNLDRRSKTLVNGERIKGPKRFLAGDQLQLGQLAFELQVELPQRNPNEEKFDQLVCDVLTDADDAVTHDRIRSPEQRWYQIEPVVREDPYEGMTSKERLEAKAREKLPPKQGKPLKLPKRKFVAPSTKEAVAKSLNMYYDGIDLQAAGWSVIDE